MTRQLWGSSWGDRAGGSCAIRVGAISGVTEERFWGLLQINVSELFLKQLDLNLNYRYIYLWHCHEKPKAYINIFLKCGVWVDSSVAGLKMDCRQWIIGSWDPIY